MLSRGAGVRARMAANRARLASHGPGLGLIGAVTIWTMRRFLFTGGIPAGTDMLGFISRAAQNSSLARLTDPWSPSSFGSRRVFSFDNILGAVTLLTRSPMVTVKLLDVLVLFGAGLGAYALAWSWYRQRLTAAIAGLLYLASQASLTRWGSGQLNVEIIISLAPVMLLAWSSCLQRFSIGRVTGFILAVGAGILVRADLVMYVVPFLVLYAIAVLTSRAGWRAGWANAARTLAVAVPGVLVLNAAWLLPSLNGYRPQYETLRQIFSLSQLSTRSLDLYQSILGFGREIGYFGFTGTETWNSFPGIPLWAYYAFATVIPVLAYLALRWHRDRRTIFLVLASVIAALTAPGSHAPLGRAYLFAARHLPVFGNLRDPNRWLIVQAIAYAVLAGLTIEHLTVAVTAQGRARTSLASRTGWRASWISAACPIVLVWIALVPVLPTLMIGLRTWHVTRPQAALLDRLREAPGMSRVASVPFDQDYRFLVQGSYRGFEHDLGYESVLFTGRQDIGDGSWTQRSANLVAYEATLLARRDPAFVAMLASTGVSRVVSFRYPLVASRMPGQAVSPYAEQHDVSALPGLNPLLATSAGTDYAVADAAAPLSFRRNLAIVLGGTQGIAALADRPGVRLSDWAVFTADDIIATQGFPRLLALMRQADVVLLAGERPVDIAVAGTRPVAELAGITSNPQNIRQQTDVPTGLSAQLGELDDPAAPIPQPTARSTTAAVTVRSPRQVAIWARVLATPLAAKLVVRVDGAVAGSVTPVTLGSGGFEWLRIATVHLSAGTHHVTLSASPSSFGDSYEVAEARVLDPGALRSAAGQLHRALASDAARVAYDFNLADAAKWSSARLAARLAPGKSAAFSLREWVVPAGAGSTVTTTAAPGGASAPQFTAYPGRSVYAVAKIRYQRPRDWAGRPYVYLDFKGTDSRNLYTVEFVLGAGANGRARYVIADDFRGWRTFAFPTADPGPGSVGAGWSRVRAVIVALPSKSGQGVFALGLPRASGPVRTLSVPLPVLAGGRRFGAAARKPVCVGGTRVRPPVWVASRRTLRLPVASLSASCSIYAPSRARYRQQPAVAVRLHRTGAESWSYSVSTHQRGVLVWTQAYDPLWALTGNGRSDAPLPVLSLLDGYLVAPGHHSGAISFSAGPSTITGTAVTAGTALALLLAAAFSTGRPRRARRGRHHASRAARPAAERWPPDPASPPLRRLPDLCLRTGAVLLGLCPVASLARMGAALMPLGLAALMMFAAAALIVAGSRTRARPLPAGPATTEQAEERLLYAVPG